MPELLFKGKEFVFNHHLAVPHRPLVPDASLSVGELRLDGNLIIHGDNLHALKSLLPMYAGKIDCIFIDPPYNTGNEGWCYNDNVNSPMMQQWLSENPVGIEDGLRHDKWCAMIWPRLRLLHELLKDSGAIFISIDNNESQHLRMMLDEVYGADNFIAGIVWQKRTSPESRKKLGAAHDIIYVYAKSKNELAFSKLVRTEEQSENFDNPDNDKNGQWTSTDMTAQNPDPSKRKDQQYKITLPNGEEVLPPPGRCWSMLEREFLKLQSQERIWFGINGSARPRIKTYLSETEGVSSWTWWSNNEVGHNQEAKKEINEILGPNNSFDYPKPVRLIRRILEIATNTDSIILDSFAGSGTTAHAVLDANRKDGGDRKFILVECEDYADSLTAERVRRVINGYSFQGTQREELMRKSITFSDLKKADKLLHQIAGVENLESHRFDKIDKKVKDGELVVEGVKAVIERVEGLGGSFTFCTLGEAIDMDRMLTGESLPEFSQLGALLFHMATNEAIDPGKIAIGDHGHGYLGESSAFHVWLIYKPDLEFLKSRDSALTLSKAKEFAAAKPAGKRHLVFAPAKFVSQKVLDEEKVPVEFAPLPWALYRIERS
ncbi:MAG: site-specific DNA-methyltransferase [Chlorobiaceae bacterium]|nr:site-specific DNA-methyltransferase [Chlorobiaceae bacterium]NTW09740.1 site-specific DNA-methyltransferase [Chlorobiaceae bacterium]